MVGEDDLRIKVVFIGIQRGLQHDHGERDRQCRPWASLFCGPSSDRSSEGDSMAQRQQGVKNDKGGVEMMTRRHGLS